MTVTAVQANVAANNLTAWGAWASRDMQGPAWADYLNHEVPDIEPDELEAACRTAFRDWNRSGRGWQINVDHVAQAVRRIRRERLDAVIGAHGRPDPEGLGDEPRIEQAWRNAWRRAIERGASHERAVASAWRAIGRTPPPPAIGSGGPAGPERARRVLAALARSSKRP